MATKKDIDARIKDAQNALSELRKKKRNMKAQQKRLEMKRQNEEIGKRIVERFKIQKPLTKEDLDQFIENICISWNFYREYRDHQKSSES